MVRAAVDQISYKYVQSMLRAGGGGVISKVRAWRNNFRSFAGKVALYWAFKF